MPDDGTVAGAVKRPFAVIVPDEADHVIVGWKLLVTVGCPVEVNCAVAPGATTTLTGETLIGPPTVAATNVAVTPLEVVVPGLTALNSSVPQPLSMRFACVFWQIGP